MGVVQDIRNDLENGAIQLVAEYRDRLLRDAVAMCGDATEAEDFVFKTLDKAIRNIGTIKNEGSLYDWMRTILQNEIRSAHRSKVVQNTVVTAIDEDTAASVDAPLADDAVQIRSDEAVVRQAIGVLPEAQREAILLHYFLEWPVAKMAKFLVLPETTVKFRLHAARKALAATLSKQMKRPLVRVALVALLCAGAVFAGQGIYRLAVNCGVSGDERPDEADKNAQGRISLQPDIFDTNQEGGNMIMTRKVASLVGATLLAVAAPGEEITSEPTFVFLRPETSSFWNTATNSTMTLPIDYPAGATKATLTVSGAGYRMRTYPNLTGDSFELELPVPDSPQKENVYDLALTFDDGTVRTAKLGLIQGLSPDSEGSTRCLAPAEGSVWNTINKRAVMPIPYGTESFAMRLNGGEWAEVDTGLNGAQGWYAIKPKTGDNVSLALVAGGINYAATLLGQGDGFFVILK